MPKILIKGRDMYYETYGSGEPIVILNGIMMSTGSWTGFTDVLSEDNQLILLDFFDQGQSDRHCESYSQDLHVESLKELLDKLNISKVHLVGISYGGEIAQKFALANPDYLYSLSLANTTSHTTSLLKDIGENWIYASKNYDGVEFFKATMPYIYSAKFYEENIDWLKERELSFASSLNRDWYDGFVRLVRSAENLDIRDEIEKIEIPTMIIGAEDDITTPIKYQEEIYKRIKKSKFIIIKDSGHASMYEKPYEFISSILGFIKVANREINIL